MTTRTVSVAVRDSTGVSIHNGPPLYNTVPEFSKDESKTCKTMLFCPNGNFFAWTNGVSLKIAAIKTWSIIAEIPASKIFSLGVSPLGTYLMTWEPYIISKNVPQGTCNMHIYKFETGELVKSFVHKKQSDWELQFSADEKICARHVNNDVIFYENANFENISNRTSFKVESFSLACTVSSYYVVTHTPAASGQPSFGRLFKYPNLALDRVVANKTFFQADNVNFFWNAKGTSVLLLTSTEVDKSDSSYYGKQALHNINTKGDTVIVQFKKEGPIYSVAWSPKSTEFCVVYGFMPAMMTLFNLQCEPIFELGTGPFNTIRYNPHGNILLIGGFGNLQGSVKIWNTATRKLVGECKAADSTQIDWSPDGTHFSTATTAPRLRIGNGYKIWHYSGALLHECSWGNQGELYEILWQKLPKDAFPEPTISNKVVEGIKPSEPQASKEAYRPPIARGSAAKKGPPGYTPSSEKKPEDAVVSKAALKQRKKRELQKAKRQNEEVEIQTPKPKSEVTVNNPSSASFVSTGDPEKDKKIKNLKKKLDAINKLKEQKSSGKPLEINQLSKIETEKDLLKELQELTIS